MDENKLKSMAITLRWENRYRTGKHLNGKGSFLPELATLDQDYENALKRLGISSGKLLEIGTGLGLQAIRFAQTGYEVIATDVSATAMENARKNAQEEGLDAARLNFVTDNILRTKLQGTFDVIADRGCFTTLKQWELEDYSQNVYRLIKTSGVFLIKIDAEQYAKTKALETRFKIEEQYDTFYYGSQTQGPRAGFLVMKPLDL
ncbi:MAG: class I SAM-dependent methyltransferase [Gallionellaceae bacterium]